jgi:hypothetical protein
MMLSGIFNDASRPQTKAPELIRLCCLCRVFIKQGCFQHRRFPFFQHPRIDHKTTPNRHAYRYFRHVELTQYDTTSMSCIYSDHQQAFHATKTAPYDTSPRIEKRTTQELARASKKRQVTRRGILTNRATPTLSCVCSCP